MVTQAKTTPSPAERLYTLAEFETMPESYGRWELWEGRLVEKPMAKVRHSNVVDKIRITLFILDPNQKLGSMLAEVNVALREGYAPAPDQAFWLASRVPPLEASIAEPPDLAIEVQSPGQSLSSLQQKSLEYIKAGVTLVWLIQPDKKKVLIYRQNQPMPETIGEDGILNGEDVIMGFSLPVASLFVR